MLATGAGAVTKTTPPQTQRDLVSEAIAAGVHVIADKPFAPSAAASLWLLTVAARAMTNGSIARRSQANRKSKHKTMHGRFGAA